MMQNFPLEPGTSESEFFPVDRSFVVQIEAQFEFNKGQFSGRIEHVVTGKSTRFHSLQELLDFIESNT